MSSFYNTTGCLDYATSNENRVDMNNELESIWKENYFDVGRND